MLFFAIIVVSNERDEYAKKWRDQLAEVTRLQFLCKDNSKSSQKAIDELRLRNSAIMARLVEIKDIVEDV